VSGRRKKKPKIMQNKQQNKEKGQKTAKQRNPRTA